MKDQYDVIVAGAGLGGLTAARRLADAGHSVLLAERHSQFGGLATYFKRRSHLFDVALHGFPIGMKKSFRKYWGKEFADHIVQVKSIRFDNPQFSLDTTFDKEDFTRILTEKMGVRKARVDAFFHRLAGMNFYDDNTERTRHLFQQFFPGRTDVWRLLMEPIAYANGSTLDEPAITYGIVFGNFMSKGVYIFRGGTDLLLKMMLESLRERGVDCESSTMVERILVDNGKVRGAVVNGKEVGARAVISNGSLIRTVREWVGEEHFSSEFLNQFSEVRVSNSSCQVYIGIKPGLSFDYVGDMIFSSECPEFDSNALSARHVTSRTFSIYYPEMRPWSDQYTIVASMNSWNKDWAGLTPEQYRRGKDQLVEYTLDVLEKYIPMIRLMVDHTEAATPLTFERYTLHVGGASFGTKFEGLNVSTGLSKEVSGLYHTGSVGIIMSGWLGAANYGVITANEADKYLAGA